MYQEQNSLHRTLNRFERLDWIVDYPSLTLSAHLTPYLKHTNIYMSGEINEVAGTFELYSKVRTQYAFSSSAEQFLSYVAKSLYVMGVEFEWMRPATFHCAWSASCLGEFRDLSEDHLALMMHERIRSMQRFTFACAHILKAHARSGFKQDKVSLQMQPRILALFCIPELFFEQGVYN